ncbi:MAG TPA: Clp protease N-terminal domain-containing protein [Actinospica sp.]|nr:Clp protease N-terminal domain-containing protein [Actinospica sp.]
MFERFTDRARRVVVLAQEEARRLNHNYIGTEHVLLGLLHEGEGMAAHALADVGVSLDAVRERVFEAVGAGQKPAAGHIPFTPRTKKVLELSLREALQLGTDYIGTEHLLLGLIREGEGVGAQVLAQLGGGLDAVRAAVIALYERRPADLPEAESLAESAGEAGAGGERRGTLRGVPQGREATRAAGAGPAARESVPGSARVPAHAADPVVPRPSETERLLAALGRRERNNALIVGPSGAGKSALVRGLGRQLARRHGPASLGGAEVLELDLLSLHGGAERLVRRRASPVVLIEDLDALLAADELSGGRMTMAVLGLADAQVPFVLTATEAAHERLVRTFPTLAGRFEVIELPAAGQALTMQILQALRPGLLEYHRILIEDSALAAAVELGALGVGGRVLPGAAVDLLDTAAARLSVSRAEGEDLVLDAARLRATSEAGDAAGAGSAGGGLAGTGSADDGGRPQEPPPATPGPPAAA